VPSISPAAWAAISQYRFPGNVRELSHAVEHALVLSGGGEIDLGHLPPSIAGARSELPEERRLEMESPVVRPLHLALRDFEHQYLLRALKAADGKRTRTADMLGISRKTLWEKLRHNGSDSRRDPTLEGGDIA
jgi:DNA-binding NtrC family response regulator